MAIAEPEAIPTVGNLIQAVYCVEMGSGLFL